MTPGLDSEDISTPSSKLRYDMAMTTSRDVESWTYTYVLLCRLDEATYVCSSQVQLLLQEYVHGASFERGVLWRRVYTSASRGRTVVNNVHPAWVSLLCVEVLYDRVEVRAYYLTWVEKCISVCRRFHRCTVRDLALNLHRVTTFLSPMALKIGHNVTSLDQTQARIWCQQSLPSRRTILASLSTSLPSTNALFGRKARPASA